PTASASSASDWSPSTWRTWGPTGCSASRSRGTDENFGTKGPGAGGRPGRRHRVGGLRGEVGLPQGEAGGGEGQLGPGGGALHQGLARGPREHRVQDRPGEGEGPGQPVPLRRGQETARCRRAGEG